MLRIGKKEFFPLTVAGLGNPRGNENPFILAFGVLWFRYHNLVAQQIHEKHPDLNDEQVFNRAKLKVIAVHQVCSLFMLCRC